MVTSLEGRRVWVAGHRGLVGSALVRRLKREHCSLLTATRSELDLRDRVQVDSFVASKRPEFVFLAAATVGGIEANRTRPAEFLYDNLMIAANAIDACAKADVSKLLFLGSSCIYPRMAPQPMNEEVLLTGALESTNEPYAIAKIAGIKLCSGYRSQYGANFISAMPTNLYGPRDNFDLRSSHVLPALIRKFHAAKQLEEPTVPVWGTGKPRREFLHVDDLADALVFLMQHYEGEPHINVGTGEDLPISELAELVARVVGYQGDIVFDPKMPDGTPRKLLNIDRIKGLGWSPSIELEDGIRSTYGWFLENEQEACGHRGAAA